MAELHLSGLRLSVVQGALCPPRSLCDEEYLRECSCACLTFSVRWWEWDGWDRGYKVLLLCSRVFRAPQSVTKEPPTRHSCVWGGPHFHLSAGSAGNAGIKGVYPTPGSLTQFSIDVIKH